jgi:hypothetical protein
LVKIGSALKKTDKQTGVKTKSPGRGNNFVQNCMDEKENNNTSLTSVSTGTLVLLQTLVMAFLIFLDLCQTSNE